MAIRNAKKSEQVPRSFLPVHCLPTQVAQRPAKPAPDVAREYVAVAAYFLAEKNGFSGDPGYYWIEAEKQMACTVN